MKEINLFNKDGRDLLLLWAGLNHLQCIGRADLVKNQTKSEKIETQWLNETVDEFDRLMTLKAQISSYIEKSEIKIKAKSYLVEKSKEAGQER